jgi:hypothetical protein
MRKSLSTVIRLQRWDVDAERRTVTEADAVVRAIEEALDALAQRCEAEKRCARDTLETGSFAVGPYFRRVGLQRAELENQRVEAETRLQEARSRLAEAYREQRKFELAEAEQRRRAAEQRAKLDQQILDELALTRHPRSKDGFGRAGAD